jgi:hypothetical protein
MRSYSGIVIIAIITFFMLGCKSYTPLKVKHINLQTGDKPASGFYYSLPQTVITLDFFIVKTEFEPGPLAAFAAKYLSIENANKEAFTEYSIEKIVFGSKSKPDPEQMYFALYNPKKSHPGLSVNYTETGLIKSVNVIYDDITDKKESNRSNTAGVFKNKSEFIYFLDNKLVEKIDTIFEDILVDTILIQKKRFLRSFVEKSSEARAKEIAEKIINIRDKKYLLISGFSEITYSKETIAYMYEELNKLEQSYLDLFTGIATTSIIKYNFSFIPNANALRQSELFKFSDSSGILLNDSTQGKALFIEVQPVVKDYTKARFKGEDVINQDGFYYRTPAEVLVKINIGTNTIAETTMLVSQFGKLSQLPADNIEIIFYPETGAIKSIRKIQD